MNYDSYTGQMLHNYYLYDSSETLQFLPWDYNLGFGTFPLGAIIGNEPEGTPHVELDRIG